MNVIDSTINRGACEMTMTTEATALPVLIRKIGAKLLNSGAPVGELVAALIGEAIDLTKAEIGHDRTRQYFADIALLVDDDLQKSN